MISIDRYRSVPIGCCYFVMCPRAVLVTCDALIFIIVIDYHHVPVVWVREANLVTSGGDLDYMTPHRRLLHHTKPRAGDFCMAITIAVRFVIFRGSLHGLCILCTIPTTLTLELAIRSERISINSTWRRISSAGMNGLDERSTLKKNTNWCGGYEI
jgi:hypothetical protein